MVQPQQLVLIGIDRQQTPDHVQNHWYPLIPGAISPVPHLPANLTGLHVVAAVL